MGYVDIDTRIGRKLKRLRETARQFGKDVVRPAGIRLDAYHDPSEVIEKSSPLWDVVRGYRELGFHKIMIPRAFGGDLGRYSSLALPVINEEIGYADGGLGISLLASCMPFLFAMLSPDASVRDWARAYAADTKGEMIGCWAITEPAHGSDWIQGVSRAGNDPRTAPSLVAVKKGDDYILNGAKSAWVSNGTIATHAVLHVGLDQSMGIHGSGLALCPLDLPGISKGAPLNKIGQRALNQGEIFFNDVVLPKKYMLFSIPGMFGANTFGHTFLGIANSSMGSTFAGQARASMEESLRFARSNRRGGSLLSDQPEIKIKLFHMFSAVEASRMFSMKVANHFMAKLTSPMFRTGAAFRGTFALMGKALGMYEGLNDKYDFVKKMTRKITTPEQHNELMNWGSYGVASKIRATETAYQTAMDAMQIFGEKAYDRAYPIEKFVRDARASTIEDGINDLLALASCEGL